MERKTKHRILGLLVIIALIIIAIPFFQNHKDQGTKDNLIKAPPFPAEATQTQQQPAPAASAPQASAAPAGETNPTIPTPVPVNTLLAGNGIHQTPDDAIVTPPNATPSAPEAVAPAIENPAIPADESATPKKSDVMPVIQDQDTVKPQAAPIKRKPASVKRNIKQVKTLVKLKSPSPFDNNGLAKLQNSAWVIQLGSFKNKSNALRLVNKLRAGGYTAFIQQFSTSMNEGTTRVFVGPQEKEVSARLLASKLEKDLHLKGIVISYKPLTL